MKLSKLGLPPNSVPRAFTSIKGVVTNSQGEVAIVEKTIKGKPVYSLIGGKGEKGDESIRDAFSRESEQEGGLIIESISEDYALAVKGKVFAVVTARMSSINPELISLSKKEVGTVLVVKFMPPSEALRLINDSKKKKSRSRLRDEFILSDYMEGSVA